MAKTTVPQELSSTPNITDNGTATAITIDSSQNATFAGDVTHDAYTKYPANTAAVLTTGGDAAIFGGTSAFPSAVNGNLVLQSRPTAGAAIYAYTGATPTLAMTIDGSQNVGIGTTPASGVRLDIRADAATAMCDFRNASSSGSALYAAGGSSTAGTYAFRAADYQNNALFSVMGDGDVLVGTTSTFSVYKAIIKSNYNLALQGASGTSTGDIAFVDPSGGGYWRITSDTSTFYIADADFSNYAYLGQNMTSWGFASDRRIKENIQDIDYGLAEIMQLQPKQYDFIKGGVHSIGFIAQDVVDIIPEAVHGTEQEFSDSDTELERLNKTMGMSKDAFIPVLVKAIQEQQAIIDDLKARIETLEGA